MGKNKGFTLVEILIVVAIIGLLASIILVGLSSFRARGRDARRIADLHQVQNALELYFIKNGSYPTTAPWTGVGSLTDTLKGAGIGVNAVPNDPNSGSTYNYASAGGNTYVIGATLEDGTNPALTNDVDGTGVAVYSITGGCDDPVYCVQF